MSFLSILDKEDGGTCFDHTWAPIQIYDEGALLG